MRKVNDTLRGWISILLDCLTRVIIIYQELLNNTAQKPFMFYIEKTLGLIAVTSCLDKAGSAE